MGLWQGMLTDAWLHHQDTVYENMQLILLSCQASCAEELINMVVFIIFCVEGLSEESLTSVFAFCC